MVKIISGKDWEGNDCEFYMEKDLVENAERIKKVVTNKDFDFVAICAGYPGTGKSTFSISLAKYFDENFTIKNIAFTAQQFIEITNNVPKHSAVILDESFASLNSKLSLSTDFLRIVNHLQLIRQKNLFIILNLPNFFDLHKGIALYRSSWLFVIYSEEFGERGTFCCYDRESKRILYIKGMKYMDYSCEQPNFRGRFFKQKAISQDEYEKLKAEHLSQQEDIENKKSSKIVKQRDALIYYMKNELGVSVKQISSLIKIGENAVYKVLEYMDRALN